jgi:hypothetical protein
MDETDTAPEETSDGGAGSEDGDEGGAEVETESEAEANGITARYRETEAERRLAFDREGSSAVIAQNREGYAMLGVRKSPTGQELERYYGFDMALDHAAELLEASPNDLPIPPRADDMGM